MLAPGVAPGAPGAAAPGSGWKKTTRSKVGPLPQPEPDEVAEAADTPPAPPPLRESARVTRWTPLTSRRRDISRATSSCVFVHPFISNAGAEMVLRSEPVEAPPPLPPGPETLAPGLTVPTSDCSEVFAGTTCERSPRAACQSKRLPAI